MFVRTGSKVLDGSKSMKPYWKVASARTLTSVAARSGGKHCIPARSHVVKMCSGLASGLNNLGS